MQVNVPNGKLLYCNYSPIKIFHYLTNRIEDCVKYRYFLFDPFILKFVCGPRTGPDRCYIQYPLGIENTNMHKQVDFFFVTVSGIDFIQDMSLIFVIAVMIYLNS